MNKKKKILFLINPKSGVQSKKRVPELIEKYIDREKYIPTIEYTQYAGHACELTRKAVENGMDIVVAVGGDGTINEVGRSLVHSSTAMGVIPCGSGNGFARHLGIPMNIRRSIEFINNAEVATIDYGKINGNPFFCSCGVGFDALVSYDFSKGNKRGFFSYITKSLADWVKFKPETYDVELESVNRTCKAFVIACGNASQYGNNAYIAPYASMRDGLLTVAVLVPFSTLEVPIIAAGLFRNTLDQNRHMTLYTSRQVKIKRKKAGPAHFDGEPSMMDAEILVEIVPDGINVLTKPGWDGTCAPVPVLKQVYDMVAGS